MSLECQTADQILTFLDSHSEWTEQNNSLIRHFTFKDFTEAFGFITKVAEIADKQDHHPLWSNCYNKVSIEITTHEADGITHRDFSFIEAVDLLL